MLMAAGLPLTNKIVVDGFILGEGGVKMSKTLGNVVDPLSIIDEYGTEALRYFVLREFHSFEDTPVSVTSLKESYNANLANGVGNVVSRVMKMASDNLSKIDEHKLDKNLPEEFCQRMESYNLQHACDFVWGQISEVDKIIQETQPFKLVKEDKEKGQEILEDLVKKVYQIAITLEPLLPETSQKIKEAVLNNQKPENLFVRKN